IAIDESGVTSEPPTVYPTPGQAPAQIYSTTFARTVNFDGACYSQPQFVPVLENYEFSTVPVVSISGCQDASCGPQGYYCYISLVGSQTVTVPQPIGQPSPFIAFGTNPGFCYGSPSALVQASGTSLALFQYTGTTPPNLVSYSGTTLCGSPYQYVN